MTPFKVFTGAHFRRLAKRLAKRYPSLPADLEQLADLLESNPRVGTPLGMSAYKLRMPIRSKGKGKSGGARVIYYMISAEAEIWMLTIYDKSELDSLSMDQIQRLIQEIQAER